MESNPIRVAESYRSYLASIMSIGKISERDDGIDEEYISESVQLSEVQSFVDIHLVSRSVSNTSRERLTENTSNCILCVLF